MPVSPRGGVVYALWPDVSDHPLRGGTGWVLGRDTGEVRETGLPPVLIRHLVGTALRSLLGQPASFFVAGDPHVC